MQVSQRLVHRLEVALDDSLPTLAIGLFDGGLDSIDGFVTGQNTADGEETSLHNGIDATAHAGILGHFIGVDDVELQLLLEDCLLRLYWQGLPHFIGPVDAVQQEDGPGFGVLEDIITLEEGELVTGDEMGLTDQIGCVDRLRAKAQVRGGDGACLLGVVDEIALRVVVGFLTDDLDRVLVGAYRAVRTETEEHGAYRVFTFDGEFRVVVDAGMSDVVVDAQGKMTLGGGLLHFLKQAVDHRGRELLGRQPIAAANDPRYGLERRRAGGHCFLNGDTYILVKGLACGTRFLSPIQDADHFCAGGKRLDKMLDREGPEESDDDDTDLLALLSQGNWRSRQPLERPNPWPRLHARHPVRRDIRRVCTVVRRGRRTYPSCSGRFVDRPGSKD